MEPKNFYLKAFNLTHNLSEVEANELSSNFTHKEAKKSQIIYAKGDEKKILFLVSGKVKISEVNEKGDEIIKELVMFGEMFGDIMFNYEDLSYEYAEVVSERASYYAITQEQLASIMRTNHNLTMNYISKFSEKFRNLENRYINMASQDVKSRLLFYFRELGRKEGKRLGDKVVIKNSLTHNDLAKMIFTSRQTVTVILNELKNAGIIKYTRKEIEFSQNDAGS